MITSTKITDLRPRKKNNIAVVLHLFYPELFDEICGQLAHISDGFDLYVSLPEDQAAFESKIRSVYPDAVIYLTENRGRDLAPFVDFLKVILPLDYSILLKIHTKKTLHREDGTSWRKDVFEKLVGSSVQVATILRDFAENPGLGMVGPQEHVLDSRFYMGKNKNTIQELIYRSGIAQSVPERFSFVASTMFWARPDLFKPLLKAAIEPKDFEPEPLPNDGSLAHALERFFGWLVAYQGMMLTSISHDGQLSEPDPFEIYPFATPPAHLYLRNLKSAVYYPAYQEAYAIEHLRITAPLRAAGIEIINGSLNGVPNPELVVLGDAVIFQREFPKNIEKFDQIVSIARSAGKFILYEIDDLLFNLPEDHPERTQELYNEALLPMLTAMVTADLVIVPTWELCKWVEAYNPNVIVLPNYLDDNLWQMQQPIRSEANQRIKIGYMGSNSHTPDLALILPAFQSLFEKYPRKISLEIWGTPLPGSLDEIEQVSWHPSPTNVYTEFVKLFQTRHFDIVVAPLVDNVFNRCKSGLKFLEYGAIGVAGVYSRLEPYQEIVSDGRNGFLAGNTQEWVGKLSLLIEDPELRFQIANSAQETIREKWLLSQNVHSWTDIFEKLNRPIFWEDNEKQYRELLINTINRQDHIDRLNQNWKYETLEAEKASCQDEIHSLESIVNHLETEKVNCQDEIHSLQKAVQDRDITLNEIYNSRAWKAITRYREGRAKLARIKTPVRKLLTPLKRILPGLSESERQTLLNSSLFDAEYYLKNNPDVHNSGMEPVAHYLNFGGLEGRNPSKDFDSKFYLENNPDVLRAGMNPLLHYIRFGEKEGRAIKPEILADQEPSQTEVHVIPRKETNSYVPERVVLADRLAEMLQQKLREEFVISLSHDDYLSVTGGSQVYIADEQFLINGKGKSYLQVYPFRRGNSLVSNEALLYLGINLDGTALAETEANEFINAFKALQGKQIEKLSLHQTMGFSEKFIQSVLSLNGNKGEFWLHDYFSLCPSYNLRLNDGVYCGAPEITSNACNICRYRQTRANQQPIFERLFRSNHLQIVSPSRFTYELWQARFPVRTDAKIIPPALLDWKRNSPLRYQLGALRIGFLGYPLDYKGWKTWMRLNQKFVDGERYQFYHFSTQAGEPGNYVRIETNVTKENRTAMIDALRDHRMDVALLWSTVAETFSFTLHEALAAGCFILTNPNSGNIQDFLKRNPERGIVLEDENALIDLFESGEIINKIIDYQKDGKPQADLIFGSLKESMS